MSTLCPAAIPQLMNHADTEVLLDIIKYIQLVAQTEPLASMVEEQTDPVPDSADDEIIRYIRAGSGVCDEMVHGVTATNRFCIRVVRICWVSVFVFVWVHRL